MKLTDLLPFYTYIDRISSRKSPLFFSEHEGRMEAGGTSRVVQACKKGGEPMPLTHYPRLSSPQNRVNSSVSQ
jgi:hypothetical protein